MKIAPSFLISVFSISAFLGCDKVDPIPVSTAKKSSIAHVEFVDQITGEPVKELEILFGKYNDVNADPGNFTVASSKLTNTDGSTNIVQSLRPTFVKPNDNRYADITYVVDGTEPYNNWVLPFKKCKLLNVYDGVSYYRAEMYRRAPVDIHIKQVTEIDLSAENEAMILFIFSGEDPTDSLSKYYMRKDFRSSGALHIAPGTKLDTVFRAYAFGNLENTFDWSIYIQAHNPDDYRNSEYAFSGTIERKKYSSSGPETITITF